MSKRGRRFCGQELVERIRSTCRLLRQRRQRNSSSATTTTASSNPRLKRDAEEDNLGLADLLLEKAGGERQPPTRFKTVKALRVRIQTLAYFFKKIFKDYPLSPGPTKARRCRRLLRQQLQPVTPGLVLLKECTREFHSKAEKKYVLLLGSNVTIRYFLSFPVLFSSFLPIEMCSFRKYRKATQ